MIDAVFNAFEGREVLAELCAIPKMDTSLVQ
ncbi:hypothetical protein ABID08_000669 [Rhizobium binae]|uniref:Uncharacterized protein n=1 Tax=Rhizobium binae TaxID=1138190 RepID=A0ABV2MA57_9HYPH